MAFAELYSSLGWSESFKPLRHFILVEDTLKADANFLLQAFVYLFARQPGTRTCLVGFGQSFFHYAGVAKKLGLNLAALGAQFTFVDALSQPYSWEGEKIETPTILESSRNINFTLSCDSEDPLGPLLEILVQQRNHGEDPLCIIIDDITALLNVCTISQIYTFLRQCMKQLVQTSSGAPVTLVALVHSDIDAAASLVGMLERQASIVFAVSEFEFGTSRDVHGQLVVSANLAPPSFAFSVAPGGPLAVNHTSSAELAEYCGAPGLAPSGSILLHYKTLDNAVRFFLPGTA